MKKVLRFLLFFILYANGSALFSASSNQPDAEKCGYEDCMLVVSSSSMGENYQQDLFFHIFNESDSLVLIKEAFSSILYSKKSDELPLKIVGLMSILREIPKYGSVKEYLNIQLNLSQLGYEKCTLFHLIFLLCQNTNFLDELCVWEVDLNAIFESRNVFVECHNALDLAIEHKDFITAKKLYDLGAKCSKNYKKQLNIVIKKNKNSCSVC